MSSRTPTTPTHSGQRPVFVDVGGQVPAQDDSPDRLTERANVQQVGMSSRTPTTPTHSGQRPVFVDVGGQVPAQDDSPRSQTDVSLTQARAIVSPVTPPPSVGHIQNAIFRRLIPSLDRGGGSSKPDRCVPHPGARHSVTGDPTAIRRPHPKRNFSCRRPSRRRDHEQRRREDDEGDEGSRGRRLACA